MQSTHREYTVSSIMNFDDLATLHCRRVIIYGKMIRTVQKYDVSINRTDWLMEFIWLAVGDNLLPEFGTNGVDLVVEKWKY